MAFLDGAPPERLCQPMVDYITARGGEVHMNSPLRQINLNDDSTVKSFTIASLDENEKKELTADLTSQTFQLLRMEFQRSLAIMICFHGMKRFYLG